jgi:hypothetical protein
MVDLATRQAEMRERQEAKRQDAKMQQVRKHLIPGKARADAKRTAQAVQEATKELRTQVKALESQVADLQAGAARSAFEVARDVADWQALTRSLLALLDEEIARRIDRGDEAGASTMRVLVDKERERLTRQHERERNRLISRWKTYFLAVHLWVEKWQDVQETRAASRMYRRSRQRLQARMRRRGEGGPEDVAYHIESTPLGIPCRP